MSYEENPIKYVCLSDLHLGEEGSILNEKNEDGFAASHVMNNLAECLKSLFAGDTTIKETRPILILNGDIMDLALGQFEDATTMFESFMALIMRKGEEIFNDTIIFIPGNHDHHIWEMTREERYKTNFFDPNNQGPLPVERHTSDMVLRQIPRSDHKSGIVGGVDSTFLHDLLIRHRFAHDKEKDKFSGDLKVQLFYPCLAILSNDQKICAVFHHGHFTEEPYSWISKLNTIFTQKEFPTSLDEMEIENFAWIDFLWSSLGRSGAPGKTVKRVYKCVKNEKSCDNFLDVITANINEKCHIPFLPGIWLKRMALKHIVIPALRGKKTNMDLSPDDDNFVNPDVRSRLSQFIQQSWPMIESEIRKPVFNWDGIPKNDKDKIDLLDFLIKNFNICGHKTARHLVRYGMAKFEKKDNDRTIMISVEGKSISLKQNDKDEVILELGNGTTIELIVNYEADKKNIYYRFISDVSLASLVYGHTHKPFNRIVNLDMGQGINKSISVYNTGGWIVDQTEIDKEFGASIILMDHDLNMVYLQVYSEGGLNKILVDSTDKQSNFYKYIMEKKGIADSPNIWTELKDSAKNEYEEKAEYLRKQLK